MLNKDEDEEVNTKQTGEIIQFRMRSQFPEVEKKTTPANLIEPLEVIGYRRKNRKKLLAWLILPAKIIAACIVALALLSLPDFQLDLLVTWKNPVIVLLTVCYIGKSLFDTLFYDHYLP